MRLPIAVFFTALPACMWAGSDSVATVLQRQSQELFDAIPQGKVDVWDRYIAPNIVYAAEDGTLKTKAQLLDDLKPFPKDIWGRITLAKFTAQVHGTTAIINYVVAETEGYFGQTLHARYLETDTWQETGGAWKLIAAQVLALRDDPPSISPTQAALDAYAGTYRLTPQVTYTIRREGDHLTGQRTGRKPETLKAEVADLFFVPGQPRLRKVFQRDAAGHITGFVERRESWDIIWKRAAL